jgi:hypothetical protein
LGHELLSPTAFEKNGKGIIQMRSCFTLLKLIAKPMPSKVEITKDDTAKCCSYSQEQAFK